MNHCDVVLRAHGLRQHVLNASGFKHSANTATSDKTGTGRSGFEQHFATVVNTENIVRDRVALELHHDHALVSVGRALLDGLRNFVGLAVADANFAFAVTDNGERGKAKATATFDHLGAAIDKDDFFNHLGQTVGAECWTVTVVATGTATVKFTTRTAVVTVLPRWCRSRSGGRGRLRSGFGAHVLEYQATFAGGFCEYFYFTVIRGACAVEYDGGDSGGLGLGGKSDAELLRSCDVRTKLLCAKFGVETRQEYEGDGGVVVDRLGVNVLAGETDTETWTFGGAFDFLADSPAAFLE